MVFVDEDSSKFDNDLASKLKARVSSLFSELSDEKDKRLSVLNNVYHGTFGTTSVQIRWYLTSKNRELTREIGKRGEFVASCYASKAVLDYLEMKYPDLYGRLQRAR